MDSPTALSRYILQNSKKRVFVSGSSSSACKEVEVLEISPPSSRPKSSKQKEVICHEVIDVDMDEDCDEASLTDQEVDKSAKGKKVLSNSSVGVSSLANEESGDDVLTSNSGAVGLNDSNNVDDFSSDLYYGDDEWIESYYDDIIFDETKIWDSHFDHMDIPPGVEVPFPWLPSSGNDTKVPTASNSTLPNMQSQSNGVGISPGLNSFQSSWSSKHPEAKDQPTSCSNTMTSVQRGAGNQHTNGKLGQKTSSTSSSSFNLSSQPSKCSLTHKSGKEPWHSSGKSKRKPRGSHATYASYYNQFPSGPMYPTPSGVIGGGSNPTVDMPPNALGVGNSMPVWQDLPLDMLGSSGHMNSGWEQNSASIARAGQRNLVEILHNFDHFKKFDTVEDYSDHHYSKNSSANQPPKSWAKRIQEEWKILEKDLPDEIFVRVYESRMDLLRAVIIGAEGTPYHDGLFFFDVFFPSSYPNVPPLVYYHSGGLRINPNLYNCGKVCLSLLNTWTGVGKEKWIPVDSTMLQVLVSIQGLILNAKPYFNEPGYESSSGTAAGEKRSLEYNEKTFMHSLQTMVYSMRRPPKNFEDFVIGYFCKHARDILVSCKAYLDGAQVGCLVRGGVQDVDEGDKSCSLYFKNNLAGFITTLVNTFSEIGAKDCQEFLSLAQMGNGIATAAPRAFNFLD